MKKVLAIISIIILSCLLFGSGVNCYADTGHTYIEGGDTNNTATLLTDQTSYVKLVPEEDWSMGWELWYNRYPLFKFIPRESGDYTITFSGFGDSCTYDFEVKDSEHNSITYQYCNFDQSYQSTFTVEAGQTYYIYINASTKYTTYYTLTFDKPLISSEMSIQGADTVYIPTDNTRTTVYQVGGVEVDWVWSINGEEPAGVSIGAQTGELLVEPGVSPSTIEIQAYSDILDLTISKTVVIEAFPYTITIEPSDAITVDSRQADLPRATVHDGDENGDVVTGKKVVYTCEALSDYAIFFVSDHCISFYDNPPLKKYTVTVSLEDNSAAPITFDIIIGSYSIVLSPAAIDLVKDGTDNDFYVNFPETTVFDVEGNQTNDTCGIAAADFIDYITGEPMEEGFSLSKDIPLGTYTLKYSMTDKELVTADFKIIVRNPVLTYTASEGGSITGVTAQTVAPGTSGTEVTAVPDEGYVFVKWSDDVTNVSRTENNVTGDVSVTAAFAPVVSVNIDADSTGDTLQDKIETILNGNPCAAVTTLNITAGELTDSDVSWIGMNLANLETLNITGTASFTNDQIPDYAFKNLKKLKSVTIDLNETESLSFGNSAFEGCSSLIDINLPQAQTFGVRAFDMNYQLKTVNLPQATSFGDNAFNNCLVLENVNLPKTKSIGSASFAYCRLLKSIELPNLEVVLNQTFTGCDELIYVNLSNVKEFGDYIFWGCKKPIEMILGSIPPTINETPWTGTFGQYLYEESSKVLIPEDALEAYKASAGWAEGSWYGWPVETYSNASDDNTLSGLKVDDVTIPNFNPETTTYNLENTKESSMKIDAIANDSNASVTGDTGIQNLSYGTNTFTITVIAENGTTKDYTLTITREIKVATPTASPNGGNFVDAIQVTLASTTTGASIYYTLDESEPTTQSDIYISPITINQTTTLKAIAKTEGAIDSDILTVTFTKNSSSSGSDSSSSSSDDDDNDNTNNTVMGEADNKSFNVGEKETIYNDGQREIIVKVNENNLENQVNKIDNESTISIPIIGNTDVAKTELNVQDIKNMQEKELVLEIKTDDYTYELPTNHIDIEAISEKIGKDIKLNDITFSITISKTKNKMVKVVENATKEKGLSIVIPPVDFEIEAVYKDKSCKVDKFNSFVKRMVEIPKGIDGNKITTAIITEKDGSIRHVPTYVTVIDGKYYATINSFTNSTYSLIYNKVTFNDVKDNHWAKAEIEKMASRLVIEGKEDGTFSPNEAITRAELVQVLVKALGLKPVEVNQFVDVESGTEYGGYIGTAYSYGIINGTSETTFDCEDFVTRQDAMTMIYRVSMLLDSLDREYITDMTNYVDYKDVSDYAKDAVMWNVKNNIIVGKTDITLVPHDNVTRAELAAVTNRLLMAAGLVE